ncbi:MAG: GGDEF domain-containing protein [Lachnospiraceae bacterium]|nr:GGDEF domain-containing protein [Lachnospiraceae bacterium]
MKNIAVICTSLSAMVFHDCFQGIRECAIANNSNVFFFSCDRMIQDDGRYERGEYNIFNATDYRDFDGVILLSNTFVEEKKAAEIAATLNLAEIPMVSIEGDYKNMYNFRIDNRHAMYEMVHHFIQDHGFKRINFVTGPLASLEAKERYAGYIDAMKDAGLEFSDSQIYQGDYMPQSGRDAAAFFLAQDSQLPEAIVCSNDFMAMGVNEYLLNRGIRVPEQVALSGFDDSPQVKFMEPRLTTVSRENYKAGYAACAKLLSDIMPEEIGTVKALQTNVIKRESCGCESREEFDQEKFRRNYFKGRDTQQFFLLETRRLFADMSEVKTMEAFQHALTPYVKHMQCDDFYLCLSHEWEGFRADMMREEMSARWEEYISEGYGSGTYLAYSHSSHSHMEFADFGIRELLEGIREKNLGRNCFVVAPVHFADRMFGYCVVSNSEYAFENPLFQSWVQNIGYALETVRKENLIAQLDRKLDSLWIYDNLTGLYNRDGFGKFALPVWRECAEQGRGVALFSVDMHELKEVNAKYGHDIGDRYIKAVALILKKQKRHGEVIMRFGGDEFLILASDLDEEQAVQYCRQIHAEVEDYNRMHNLPVNLSLLIGYDMKMPDKADQLDQVIDKLEKKPVEK